MKIYSANLAYQNTRREYVRWYVPGHVGRYAADTDGIIYSCTLQRADKFPFIKTAYKPVKQHENPQGYRYCKLGNVARIVARTFFTDTLETVDHISRVRNDNRIQNLRWSTRTGQNLNKANAALHPFIKCQRGRHVVRVTTDDTRQQYYGVFNTLGEAKRQRNYVLSVLP